MSTEEVIADTARSYVLPSPKEAKDMYYALTEIEHMIEQQEKGAEFVEACREAAYINTAFLGMEEVPGFITRARLETLRHHIKEANIV